MLACAGVAITTAATLSGCANHDGAAAAAARYVELIATAETDDLEQLWAMSAADPVADRMAGDLLVQASERIEVLEISAPEPASPTAAEAIESDLLGNEALQFTVSYALGGEEHDGIVVLAPLEHHPVSDIDSWRIVTPLQGLVQLQPTSFAGLEPDVEIAGTALGVDRSTYPEPVALFAGVYDSQFTAEPYLESAIAPITVLAGSTLPLDEPVLEPTAETTTALQEASDERFALCAARYSDCPFDIVDEAELLGLLETWDAELTSAPTISVNDGEVAIDDGALVVQSPDGPVTLSFSGTGPWVIDNQSYRPALLWTQFGLAVTL